MGLNKRLIDQAGASGGLGEPTDNFDIALYTGNSSVQSITSLDFAPDLVFIKCRTDTFDGVMFDTVRGTTKALWTTQTYAEQNDADTITSFDSNGFTTDDDNKTNRSPENFVAWCFKGGGAASTYNIDGTGYATLGAAGLSITGNGGNSPTFTGCSINTASGFGIYEIDPNHTASNHRTDFTHGLNSTPELVITKILDLASNMHTFTNIIDGSTDRGEFNSRAAFVDDTLNGVSIATSTEIRIEDAFTGSANRFLFYAFHSVDGYQKVGSYTGTGYTQNDISLSFAPRFVMVKNTSSSASWNMFDLSRDVANGNGRYLQANSNAVESNIGQGMIFLSNGFRWKDQPDNEFNGSGQTYIYLAIA